MDPGRGTPLPVVADQVKSCEAKDVLQRRIGDGLVRVDAV